MFRTLYLQSVKEINSQYLKLINLFFRQFAPNKNYKWCIYQFPFIYKDLMRVLTINFTSKRKMFLLLKQKTTGGIWIPDSKTPDWTEYDFLGSHVQMTCNTRTDFGYLIFKRHTHFNSRPEIWAHCVQNVSGHQPNTKSFNNRSASGHSNTGLFWYSDPSCFKKHH